MFSIKEEESETEDLNLSKEDSIGEGIEDKYSNNEGNNINEQKETIGVRFSRFLQSLGGIITVFLLTILVNIGVSNFYEVFEVSGESMNPTLANGSKVILDITTEDLERGSLVIFDTNKVGGNLNNYLGEQGEIAGGDNEDITDYEDYEKTNGSYYVKRIVGVPGDTVNYDGNVYKLNGKVLESEEAYLTYIGGFISEGYVLSEGSAVKGKVSESDANIILNEAWGLEDNKIPKGKYLVMGDNRGNSSDSREFGLVDKYSIEGSVVLEYGLSGLQLFPYHDSYDYIKED